MGRLLPLCQPQLQLQLPLCLPQLQLQQRLLLLLLLQLLFRQHGQGLDTSSTVYGGRLFRVCC